MGAIVERVVAAITNAIANALGFILQGMFTGILMLMNHVFGNLSDSASLTPHQFGVGGTANTFGVSGLNNMLELVIENAIMPIAIFVFAFFVMYEFIQMVGDKNNFKEFDTSIFIKWSIKTIISLFIILNTQMFVNGIFEIGAFMVERANTALTGTDAVTFSFPPRFFADLLRDGLWMFFPLFIIALLMYVLVIAIWVLAYVTILNRLLEMILYSSVAPIPFATLANQEFGQIGKNYIKGLCALALQGFFIVFTIFLCQIMITTQFMNLTQQTDSSAVIGDMVMCMVYCVVLGMMLLKTSSISKSILNAS
jgi:hypothetical protein